MCCPFKPRYLDISFVTSSHIGVQCFSVHVNLDGQNTRRTSSSDTDMTSEKRHPFCLCGKILRNLIVKIALAEHPVSAEHPTFCKSQNRKLFLVGDLFLVTTGAVVLL